MSEKVVVVSGYFDPIHIGHVDLMRRSKALGDKLVVIVNNDNQCTMKKGRPFMPQEERLAIVKAIRYVDDAMIAIDEDRSVCASLRQLKPDIFANGGDRFNNEVPELKVCNELGIEIVDNVGEKLQSSSNLTGLKAKN